MTIPSSPLDDAILAACQQATGAVIAKLPEDNRPERIVTLVPGESVVWDDCCAGQLTARVTSFTPFRTQPTRPAVINPCTITYWIVNVEIMLLRCAAVLDNAGTAPSPEALTLDGTRGIFDMARMLEALVELDFVDDIVSWTPQGPSGGCFGNSIVFRMKVDSPPC